MRLLVDVCWADTALVPTCNLHFSLKNDLRYVWKVDLRLGDLGYDNIFVKAVENMSKCTIESQLPAS